jgi:ankyrin repeat protein
VRITEKDNEGKTALFHTAKNGNFEVLQYLLTSEGGISITETDDEGNTALLLATESVFYAPIVQWLLEYGGAQITDTNNAGDSVWTAHPEISLQNLLMYAYTKDDDDEYIIIDGECVPNVHP